LRRAVTAGPGDVRLVLFREVGLVAGWF